MFRRLLWLGIGVGIGVMVVRTITKKASAFSPAGLAGQAHESISGVASSIKGLIEDVRDGMAEREEDIRLHFEEGVALDGPDVPWAQGVGQRFGAFVDAQRKQELEGERQ